MPHHVIFRVTGLPRSLAMLGFAWWATRDADPELHGSLSTPPRAKGRALPVCLVPEPLALVDVAVRVLEPRRALRRLRARDTRARVPWERLRSRSLPPASGLPPCTGIRHPHSPRAAGRRQCVRRAAGSARAGRARRLPSPCAASFSQWPSYLAPSDHTSKGWPWAAPIGSELGDRPWAMAHCGERHLSAGGHHALSSSPRPPPSSCFVARPRRNGCAIVADAARNGARASQVLPRSEARRRAGRSVGRSVGAWTPLPCLTSSIHSPVYVDPFGYV